jgi:outer membrane protein assembly factor BamE (lipoprotein component of BamABCDE complex)
MKITHILKILTVIIALSTTACVEQKEYRGYSFKQENVDKIKIGTSKDQVRTLLGTPSTTSIAGGEKWYYVGNEFIRESFFDPKLDKQNILVISFAGSSVSKIDKIDETSSSRVEVADELTPNEGNKMNAFQQFFGNLGKFNAAKDKAGAPSNRRGRR